MLLQKYLTSIMEDPGNSTSFISHLSMMIFVCSDHSRTYNRDSCIEFCFRPILDNMKSRSLINFVCKLCTCFEMIFMTPSGSSITIHQIIFDIHHIPVISVWEVFSIKYLTVKMIIMLIKMLQEFIFKDQ